VTGIEFTVTPSILAPQLIERLLVIANPQIKQGDVLGVGVIVGVLVGVTLGVVDGVGVGVGNTFCLAKTDIIIL
jgi:hypothetical protein